MKLVEYYCIYSNTGNDIAKFSYGLVDLANPSRITN